ncbi:MAG: hypothetical protein BWX48_01698 [Verrucomicrobia bacterium ADurb.Bin006]|nr:MAG: hypothetical protein BWX48_01698 [Verrucomicrobia bacterium ADurb.Bin006]
MRRNVADGAPPAKGILARIRFSAQPVIDPGQAYSVFDVGTQSGEDGVP